MHAIRMPDHRLLLATSLRWFARLTSVLSLGFIGMFLMDGERAVPHGTEWFGLALFPGAFVVGLVLAWGHEILGAAITLASVAALYMWLSFIKGAPTGGPYFAILAVPALLFLASGLARRACKIPG